MKIKITMLMILIILITVFVSQNTNIIPINLLFWKFELSTIIVISISFLLGMIFAFIITSLFSESKKEVVSTKL